MIILVVLNVDFAVHRVMNWIIRPRRGREGRGGVEGAAGRRTEGSWEGTSLEEVVLERGGASSLRVYTTGTKGRGGGSRERARDGGESWGGVSTGELQFWGACGPGRVRAWGGSGPGEGEGGPGAVSLTVFKSSVY